VLALNEKYFEVVLTNQIRYNTFYFTFCFDFRIELNYDLTKLLQVKEKNLLLEPLGINRTQDDYYGVRVSKKKVRGVKASTSLKNPGAGAVVVVKHHRHVVGER
jgi:hypothetical protein